MENIDSSFHNMNAKSCFHYMFNSGYLWIIATIIINLCNYLYRIITYRHITDYISNLSQVVLVNTNWVIFTMFIKLLILHMIHNGTHFLINRMISSKIKSLFNTIVSRMMYYNISFFKNNNNNSNKINQLWYYLNTFETLIEKLFLELPRILIFMVYYTYTIYKFSILGVLAILPINVLIMYLLHPLSRTQYRYQKESTDLDLKTKTRFLETVSNMEYIKLNNKQDYEINKITGYYDDFTMYRKKDKVITSFLSFLSDTFNDTIMLFIYVIGISYVISGKMDPVELIYLASNTGNFFCQLIQLKDIYNYYRKIGPKIGIMFEIMKYDGLENIDYKEIGFNQLRKTNDIIFYNVSFSYGTKEKVLNNVSFRFEKNKVNLLLGPNGSGKSTIVKLLFRLYEVDEEPPSSINNTNSNIIYYNGKNIKETSLRDLRDTISFVSQEPPIFNDTIMYNIKYHLNNPDTISDSEIINKCSAINLKDWLLENKDHMTGYRGRNLSGGEKKKIQMIQALCRDTDTIVFDEPSNSLDSNAIIWFIDFIKRLRDEFGKTIIIITHDLRLKAVADKTIELNKINGSFQ